MGKTPDFNKQIRDYYKLRDWDWNTGKPGKEKLEELELT